MLADVHRTDNLPQPIQCSCGDPRFIDSLGLISNWNDNGDEVEDKGICLLS